MARQLETGPLVVASHNAGKVREIADLLERFDIEIISAGDLGLPEPDETGDSFRANAQLKARAAALATKRPALADDSGLEVMALDGAPGIYSARWARETGDFTGAMERIHREMMAAGTDDDSARFICALSLCWPDNHFETVTGEVCGRLIWPPRGDKGFGYDPMFIADGQALTFGEMEADAKHAISHRADAFRKLTRRCFEAL